MTPGSDPQVGLFRFLRRFFARAYLPFSIAYGAIAATASSTYWVPAIAIFVIGIGSVIFFTFRIRQLIRKEPRPGTDRAL
jgi:hypothetical protein